MESTGTGTAILIGKSVGIGIAYRGDDTPYSTGYCSKTDFRLSADLIAAVLRDAGKERAVMVPQVCR